MVIIRDFTQEDIPALGEAIDADTFHPGEWMVDHFQIPGVPTKVVVDNHGPLAFVLYTYDDKKDFLRISCVWADTDARRNARGLLSSIPQMAEYARQHGFIGLVIETKHDKLATFLTRVFGMEPEGDEYFLKFKETRCVAQAAH